MALLSASALIAAVALYQTSCATAALAFAVALVLALKSYKSTKFMVTMVSVAMQREEGGVEGNEQEEVRRGDIWTRVSNT